jgi:hypothetical protein
VYLQEQQRLMVDFGDYPTMLLRMLNQCIREPHIHLAVFVMQPTGEGRLDFIQVRCLVFMMGMQQAGVRVDVFGARLASARPQVWSRPGIDQGCG